MSQKEFLQILIYFYFTAEMVQDMSKISQIIWELCTLWIPQSSEKTERMNQTIEANIQVTARGSSGASSLTLTGICVIPRVKAGMSTLEIPRWKAFLHSLVTTHGDQMCARDKQTQSNI